MLSSFLKLYPSLQMTTNSLSSQNRDNTTRSLFGFSWRRKSLWKAALCDIHSGGKGGGETRSQACQGLTISPIKWSTFFPFFRICPFDQLRALLPTTGILATPCKGHTLLLEWMNSLGGRCEPEVWGSAETMAGR